ncbi:MAG: LacI family DNA-binding transcriptional regulator [Mangrovicoccus sp.]
MLTDTADQTVAEERIGTGRKRATINDVARALGLTKGTVSRALNGYPDISDRTRRRVRHMADRLGYLPLAQAQAIRTGRVRAIGLVLQVGEPDAQRPFLADFLSGVTGAAGAEGWSLTVATAQHHDDTREVLERLLAERKADGFILPRTRLSDPRIDLLRQENVPFVLYGRTGDPTGCAWFDMLGEQAMAEAVHRLYAFGHRRIGFLGGAEGMCYNHLRRQGYLTAMAELGLTLAPELEARGATTIASGIIGAKEILQAAEPPTAIVCATDMAALGAMRVAAEYGLRVGQDLSLTGYDGVPQGAWTDPPLTTFEVDNAAVGARLATLLLRLIHGEAPENLRETAPARLCARGSDGPPALDPLSLAQRIASAEQRNQNNQGDLP